MRYEYLPRGFDRAAIADAPRIRSRANAATRAWFSLNLLLETERAGARLLAAYLDELTPEADAWAPLCAIQRDEARNCGVLIDLLQAMHGSHLANIAVCEELLQ